MSIFEAVMIICFGISWPFSIYRLYRTKKVHGISFHFLVFVFAGYLSGIMFKLTGKMDRVILLYILNALMVGTNLVLYLRYSKKH